MIIKITDATTSIEVHMDYPDLPHIVKMIGQMLTAHGFHLHGDLVIHPTDEQERLLFISTALRESALQFRRYEKSHREKGTPEGNDKADTNATWAEKCERALGDYATTPKDEGGGR